MADAFKNLKADRASLFCKTLESNAYKPCQVFETSCSQQKRKHQQDESPPSQTLESLLLENCLKMSLKIITQQQIITSNS